jgi:hypothetical protein
LRVGAAVGSVAVSPENADGAWLIALEGEHDLSTAALLEQATVGLWQRCTLAVVDLSGAAFIDTTVINWLMSAKLMLEASGPRDSRHSSEPTGLSFAARLFRLLSMRDVLACYPTLRDALARLRARAALSPGLSRDQSDQAGEEGSPALGSDDAAWGIPGVARVVSLDADVRPATIRLTSAGHGYARRGRVGVSGVVLVANGEPETAVSALALRLMANINTVLLT